MWPPHLDTFLRNFILPSLYSMSSASFFATEKLACRATVYRRSLMPCLHSSSHPVSPPKEQDNVLKGQLTTTKQASHQTITAAITASSNLLLERIGVVLDHLRLTDPWIFACPYCTLSWLGSVQLRPWGLWLRVVETQGVACLLQGPFCEFQASEETCTHGFHNPAHRKRSHLLDQLTPRTGNHLLSVLLKEGNQPQPQSDRDSGQRRSRKRPDRRPKAS